MGEFTNVITYSCKAYNDALALINPVVDPATYYNMILSSSATETDIIKVVEAGSISSNLKDGKYNIGQTGTYFFNFCFTFSGSASANYKIRALLNNNQIDQSVSQFTTRGSNVRWEVGMTFIAQCDYVPTSTNTGLYSSANTLQLQYQNVLGSGNLNFVSGIFNIMKIN